MDSSKFAIVVPCYNEESAILKTITSLQNIMHNLIQEKIVSTDSLIIFVDDGSIDSTWDIIKGEVDKSFCTIKGIKFTKNYGNQIALLAGLNKARELGADMVLSIDADLQQDINKIPEFIQAYKDGFDIVAGIRNNYSTNWFNKFCSKCFYKTVNFLGINLKPNHSEYRLISRKTLNIIQNFRERNIFLRGLFNNLGLKTKYINYDVKEREFGKSKFTFKSLISMALNGIISYSTYPLRLVFLTGIIISLSCFLVAFFIFMDQLFNVHILYNLEFYKIWSTFMSGVQILCLGIIGEYIGQVLLEVKGRPLYLIDEEL